MGAQRRRHGWALSIRLRLARPPIPRWPANVDASACRPLASSRFPAVVFFLVSIRSQRLAFGRQSIFGESSPLVLAAVGIRRIAIDRTLATTGLRGSWCRAQIALRLVLGLPSNIRWTLFPPRLVLFGARPRLGRLSIGFASAAWSTRGSLTVLRALDIALVLLPHFASLRGGVSVLSR